VGRKKKKSAKKTPADKTEAPASANPDGWERTKPAKKNFLDNIDYVLAGCSALIFVFCIFSTGECFVGSGTDMVSNEYPLHAFAFSWMRRGIIPLWNPFIFGGVPFQAGVHGYLYPGWWTGFVFPTCFDIKLGILLHMAGAATGGVWFARSYVKNRSASLLCWIVFALSGFFTMHCFAGHRVMIATAAYLPWVGGALQRAAAGSRKNLLFGAALCGLMLLAGHYHIVFIGMSGLLLFFLIQGAIGFGSDVHPLRGAARAAVIWAIVFAIGSLVSAVQLAPMLGTIELSQRTGGSAEFSASFSSAPANLISYLLPNVFGNKVDSPFVGDWSYWESMGYLGIAPLILILLGLFSSIRRRIAPSIAVAIVGLILALGAHTPIFDLYLTVIPGADLFRSPGRFCLLATIFLALASAQCLDAWLEGKIYPKRGASASFTVWIIPILSLAAALALHSIGVDGFKEWISRVADARRIAGQTDKYWTALLSLAKADGLKALFVSCATAFAVVMGFKFPLWARRLGFAIVALLVVDLYNFGNRFMITAPKEKFELPPRIAEEIRREGGAAARFIAPPDTRWHDFGAMYEIGNPGGYDSFIDGRWARYINFSQGKKPDRFFGYERLRRGSQLIRNLGPGFLISREPLKDGRNRGVAGYDWFKKYKQIEGLYLYRDEDPLPRATLVHRMEIIDDEEAAYREMIRPDFDIRKTVLLETNPPVGFSSPEPKRPGAEERAEIRIFEPNRVEIEVRADSKAVLVLSDTLHPGWSAFVDGNKVPMIHANRIMRAVPVPPGTSAIRMTYLPGSFIPGVIVSVLSIVGIAIAAWLMRHRWT
jgi:hypothetical protein